MQLPNTSYKEIPLYKTDLRAMVDGRDYERLMNYRWYVIRRRDTSKPYAACTSGRKTIYMHREIWLYHSGERDCYIRHISPNTLDNRYINLNRKYTSVVPKDYLELCQDLGKHHSRNLHKLTFASSIETMPLVEAISKDGVVLRSNLTSSIMNLQTQVDSLLCQRLKAAQLAIEARHQLMETYTAIGSRIAEIDLLLASILPK